MDRRRRGKLDTGEFQRRFPFGGVEIFGAGFGTGLVVNKPKIAGRYRRDGMGNVGVAVLPAMSRWVQPGDVAKGLAVITDLDLQTLRLIVVDGMDRDGPAGKGFVVMILDPGIVLV